MKTLTLHEEYCRGRKILDDAGYTDGSIDARVLICHASDTTREQFFAFGNEKTLTEIQRKNYEDMLRQRLARVPVAIIVGNKEFMGLDFMVDRSVLIPRPATETLVQLAIDKLEVFPNPDADTEHLVADIGCGSGCISLSVAYFNRKTRLYAVDISHDALKTTRENVNRLDKQYPDKYLSCRVHLLCGDLLEPLPESRKNSFSLILSNPPYVTEEEWENLMDGVKLFEPRIALVPPEGTREIYRRLAENAMEYLAPGGYLMVEIGASQAEMVSGLFRDTGYEEVNVHKDLEGFDRVVTGKKIQQFT
jgi:release factor glutamine methyltransferase